MDKSHACLMLLLPLVVSCASKTGQAINPMVARDFKEKIPSLTTPEVRRVWIEPKIESDRYVEGHFVYVIDRPAVWGK